MKVEIITTGTELLLGEILNTNVQYLSRKLNNIGFDVLYHTTVGDNPERMRAVLEQAMQRADIIITSGGLGPTRGDITKEMVMDVCEGIIPYKKAVLDEQIEEERRLFYVAMTRAKEKLYLLYPKQRYNKDTTRSRFIEELLTARYPLLRTDLHTP